MRLTLPTLLLACSLFVPSGCGGDSGRRTLAMIPKGTNHEFWNAVHAGALQAARDLDFDLVWVGPQPEGDRAAQIQVVENQVIRGVDGIVLMPVDRTALARVAQESKDAGIPVVIADSDLDWDGQVSYVATDNRKGGELAGERLVELLGGEGQVILLRYVEGSASTQLREEGFLAALEGHPGIEVLSKNQYAGNTKESAQTVSENLLTAHPGVDGVFCPNESAVHGMLMALRDAGKAGEVKFVGFDSSGTLMEGLRQKHIHALVLQDPVRMGELALRTLNAHLDGETVDARVDTGVTIADPDNMTGPEVMALLSPDLSILDE